MLYASAAGVRKVSSKLRFVLQDFAYVNVDLVQGKDFWRITSASKTNQLEDITKNPDILLIYGNIARLLRRLLAGVEANEALFDSVFHGLQVLENLETKEDLKNAELVIVFQILYHLGYISNSGVFENLARSPFEANILLEAAKRKQLILHEINKALRETQLY